MTPLLGSSFYDSLNRLVIGFLLSLWLFAIPCFDITLIDGPIPISIYVVACFITGLFFSFLIDRLAECNWRGFQIIFYKNKLERIRKTCEKEKVQLPEIEGDSKNALYTYYKYYYTVQQGNLLGNIPALETLSAFMMNLSGVCIISTIISFFLCLIRCCCYCCCCCCSYCIYPGYILIISIILLFCSKYCRDYIENKIYSNIIIAYKFLKEKSE